MTFDPALSTDRDVVRFLVGDTDATREQMADATIDKLLTLYAGPTRTAQIVCVGLAGKYSRLADQQIGLLKVQTSQLAKHYADLAAMLDEQASSVSSRVPVPFAGGISVSDKESRNDDDNTVQPFFTRDLDEFSQPTGLNETS